MRKIAANYIYPITSAPIKNGYIKLDDNGTIVEIGQLDKECEDTEFYNGILCPGFTNAHCHIELSHLKGLFKEATGMSGFINQINELRCAAEEPERRKALEEQIATLDRSILNTSDETLKAQYRAEREQISTLTIVKDAEFVLRLVLLVQSQWSKIRRIVYYEY